MLALKVMEKDAGIQRQEMVLAEGRKEQLLQREDTCGWLRQECRVCLFSGVVSPCEISREERVTVAQGFGGFTSWSTASIALDLR